MRQRSAIWASKELRRLKIRRRTLFRRDDLDAYIERHTPDGDVTRKARAGWNGARVVAH
jgi:hypothetical protein